MKPKLHLKSAASILDVATITIPRIAKTDDSFPELERVGRSIFIDQDSFYKWLSDKAGKEITASDNLLKTKGMLKYYGKSTTWLWQMVKGENIPNPFKINRTNFWLEREIVGETEDAA